MNIHPIKLIYDNINQLHTSCEYRPFCVSSLTKAAAFSDVILPCVCAMSTKIEWTSLAIFFASLNKFNNKIKLILKKKKLFYPQTYTEALSSLIDFHILSPCLLNKCVT